jgi:dolichol-phosphate mannosyltransferase
LTLSKAASMLYRQVLRNQLFTYTSCFRVYRRSAVVDIQLINNGFVGVVELLWELDRRGSRIVECPAELGVREYGQSKMRTLQVMRDHLRLMLGRLLWLK